MMHFKSTFTNRVLKARLHMRFFMRFRVPNLPQLYPARVFSRSTLRQNTTKLAEIGKKGVFK